MNTSKINHDHKNRIWFVLTAFYFVVLLFLLFVEKEFYLYLLALSALPLLPIALYNRYFISISLVLSFLFSYQIIQYPTRNYFIALDDFFFIFFFVTFLYQHSGFGWARETAKLKNMPFLLLLLAAIFSILLNLPTLRIPPAAYALIRLIQYSSLFFMFTHMMKNQEKHEVYLWTIWIGSVAVAMGGIVQHLLFKPLHVTSFLSYNHMNLGLVMNLSIILSFVLARIARGHLSKIIVVLTIPLFVYNVVISASRIAYVTFVVEVAVLLFLFHRRIFVILVGCTFVVALIVGNISIGKILDILPANAAEKIEQTYQSGSTGDQLDLSAGYRLVIWYTTLEQIYESSLIRKLFGHGLYNFAYSVKRSVLFRGASGGHNNYIHVAFELGLFGLIAFLLLFLTLFWQSVVRFRQLHAGSNAKYLAGGYVAILIGVLASGMTQESLYIQSAASSFLGFFFVFSAICLNFRSDEHSSAIRRIE